MDIKFLVLKPVNIWKYIFGPNLSYSNSVDLSRVQNSILKKKNPGGSDFQPSLGTIALTHMWETPSHQP